ncbi:MAG: hypothetical protein C0507_00225 [Cyanobacteria bacterium PR.3.49]|jgi:hypothetical protein|nr:hypothetical protein [Cyanobacteria bacterium PR.3.49]
MSFKKSKVLDQEFVDALVTLSTIHDSANSEKPSAGVSGHKINEGFYFMCGWDRLMSRFRDACDTRTGTPQIFV